MAFSSGIGAAFTVQVDCPAVGLAIGDYGWGDYDCSNIVDWGDALLIIQYFVGILEAMPDDCPDIGETILVD
jgi:hypothetical protein